MVVANEHGIGQAESRNESEETWLSVFCPSQEVAWNGTSIEGESPAPYRYDHVTVKEYIRGNRGECGADTSNPKYNSRPIVYGQRSGFKSILGGM